MNKPPNVNVFETRSEMGMAAATDIAAEIISRQESGARVRMVFAAAPSQGEVLDMLVANRDIDWTLVDAFHMDEYLGLSADAPERFGTWLRTHLFSRVPFGSVHVIEADVDTQGAIAGYAAALAKAPIDIVCMGIGVNGHIAFNDPPVADFSDPDDVKVVELDGTCRQQQVDDDCFATIDDVPTRAVTLTVPRLMRADRLFCIVPGRMKAEAVAATFSEQPTTLWPSSILTTHPDCTFYFDAEAAEKLP